MLVDLSHEFDNRLEDDVFVLDRDDLIPGAGRIFAKFKTHTVSELAGYQLATQLNVTVLPYAGFYCSCDVAIDRQTAWPGRVGILIAHVDPFSKVSLQDAARRDAVGTASFLTLCIFNRHEWGEALVETQAVKFFDLEFTLPGITPEQIHDPDIAPDCLERSLESYSRLSRAAVAEVVGESRKLGIFDEMCSLMHELVQKHATGTLRLNFSGHPDAAVIETHLHAGLDVRVRAVSEFIRAL